MTHTKQLLVVCAFSLILLVPSPVRADTVIYNFNAPQFTNGSATPFLSVSPNIGPATFLASFTANTSTYEILTQGQIPQFNGQILKSQCFCAQSLTIDFNTPVFAIGLDF